MNGDFPANSGHWFCKGKGLSRSLLSLGLFLTVPVLCGVSVAAHAQQTGKESGKDWLLFLDGSSLHGKLLGMNTSNGVKWAHPYARNPISFQQEGIDRIRFERKSAEDLHESPTALFQFHNGDQLFGHLDELNSESVVLKTRFGDEFTTSRNALASIRFLAENFHVAYEGPKSFDDWNHRPSASGNWEFQDGAFVARTPSFIGRDINLTPTSSLEFELAWSGQFNLNISLFTDVTDRFDYNITGYILLVRPGYVNLQRAERGAGVRHLGNQEIPDMLSLSQARFEFRTDPRANSLSLYMNGRQVAEWKDSSGLVAGGSGAVFYAQMNGPTVWLRNIRVIEWGNKPVSFSEPEEPLPDDRLDLVNRDRISGACRKISDGLISFESPLISLNVPVERATELYFAGQPPAALTGRSWQLQAHLQGGGRLGFQLKKWTEDEVVGVSDNFGELKLQPGSIELLQFHPKQTASLGNQKSSKTSNSEDE